MGVLGAHLDANPGLGKVVEVVEQSRRLNRRLFPKVFQVPLKAVKVLCDCWMGRGKGV